MEPFKNLISQEGARRLAAALKAVDPAFPVARFQRGLAAELDARELKARVSLIAERLADCLPDDPALAIGRLCDSLDAGPEPLHGFIVWPYTEVVANLGLSRPDVALPALARLTPRFSSEFAIRPFLAADPRGTMRVVRRWTRDADEHVRRLASEGTRPMLPWGMRLPMFLDDPSWTAPVLDALAADPSEYVRRSVANHLNDLSKAHAGHVRDTLSRWQAQSEQAHWQSMARRALRTLVKQGDAHALALLGFGKAADVEMIEARLIESTVCIGGELRFRVVVANRRRHAVRAAFDYAIHFRKAGGQLSPKVFKGRILELGPGEHRVLDGRFSFKPVTTRVLRPGGHAFQPMLNGQARALLEFDLLA